MAVRVPDSIASKDIESLGNVKDAEKIALPVCDNRLMFL